MDEIMSASRSHYFPNFNRSIVSSSCDDMNSTVKYIVNAYLKNNIMTKTKYI